MKKFNPLYSMIIITIMLSSCKKTDDWLDQKVRLNDVRPTTLKDMQAILNSENVFNASYAGMGLVSADNYFLTPDNYAASSQEEREAYIWQKQMSPESTKYDWTTGYQIVENANIVLDGLKDIERNNSNTAEYDRTKGAALFFKCYAYYSLAQIYCNAYDKNTAQSDPGLVLRGNSDVNEKSVRSTVAQTYDSMVSDLKEAINLLPATTAFQTIPTKPAAMALLAKVFLNMDRYEDALEYSDKTLGIYNTLLDFNSGFVQPGNLFPFPDFQGNPEVIFWAFQNTYFVVLPALGTGYVNPQLYDSYSTDDLRKSVFYTDMGSGDLSFRGSYYGSEEGVLSRNFCGIASNEIYLIKSESEARLNKVDLAIRDLNALLIKRYATGKFIPYTASGQEEALRIILNERRKELPFSAQIAWEDLRRLNKETRFARTLSRRIDGTTYTLPPGDPRYTLPIPASEIQLSGIQQNER
jgi:tetratricopeptide (TPR) repeat protein